MINRGITTTSRLQSVRDALDGKKRVPQPTVAVKPQPTGGKGGFGAGATRQPQPTQGPTGGHVGDIGTSPDGVPLGPTTGTGGTPAGTTLNPDTGTATGANGNQDGPTGSANDSGGPTPGPEGSVFTPPTPPTPKIDAQEEAFISDLFGGKYDLDAAAQKALNQQLFGDQTGKAIVNSRASRGRAGLGGGIGMAVEGDVRRKSAQAQQQADLDVDQQAAERAVKNRTGGAGLDMDLRRAGMDDQLVQWIMANLGPTPPPSTGGGGADPITGLTGADERQGAINRSPVVDKAEPGWKHVGGDAGFDFYEFPKGVYHRVRKDQTGSSFEDQIAARNHNAPPTVGG